MYPCDPPLLARIDRFKVPTDTKPAWKNLSCSDLGPMPNQAGHPNVVDMPMNLSSDTDRHCHDVGAVTTGEDIRASEIPAHYCAVHERTDVSDGGSTAHRGDANTDSKISYQK